MPLSLGAITVDCTDVSRTSTFWSAVLGRPIDPGANQFFAQIPPADGGPGWLFLLAHPRAEGKNPVHVEYGTEWTTLRDPEGNLFDIGRRH